MNSSIDQDSNRTLTLILYVLYIVAIFTGGLLAVIALIINYVKRSDVQGSIFASHFTWQIRTFWWYLACLLYTSPSPRDISGSRMPSSA